MPLRPHSQNGQGQRHRRAGGLRSVSSPFRLFGQFCFHFRHSVPLPKKEQERSFAIFHSIRSRTLRGRTSLHFASTTLCRRTTTRHFKHMLKNTAYGPRRDMLSSRTAEIGGVRQFMSIWTATTARMTRGINITVSMNSIA